MSNNLPAKKTNGIFNKIKEIVFKVFEPKKTINNNAAQKSKDAEKELVSSQSKLNSNDIVNMLKEENKKQKTKDDIIDAIEEHPEILDTLPVQRLVELNQLYDEKIKENSEEIECLTVKLNKLKQQVIKGE